MSELYIDGAFLHERHSLPLIFYATAVTYA